MNANAQGFGINIDPPTSMLHVLTTTTTGTGINFNANTVTTGTGFTLTVNGFTTGTGFSLSSTGTLLTGGYLANFTANSATTGTLFNLSGNGLTSGSAFTIGSSATAFTGTLGSITLSGSNAANTGTLFKVSNTGALNTGTTAMFTNLGAGLSFRVNDETGDADATPFVIDDGGYVGIGTASPSKPLHIYSNVSDYQFLIERGTFDAAMSFISPANQWVIGIDNSEDIFAIADNTSLDANVRLSIDNTGNVGIGTTSPSEILHLWSNSDVVLRIEADADNSGENDNPMLILTQDGDYYNFMIGMIGDDDTDPSGGAYTNTLGNSAFLGNNESARMQFGTDGSVKMTIDAGGNVGIGTNNPAYTLDVVGTGAFTPAASATNALLLYSSDGLREMRIEVPADGGNNPPFIFETGNGFRFEVDDDKVLELESNNDVEIDGVSGTLFMTDYAGDQVGIGTNNPERLLDIQSNTADVTANPQVRIENSGAGDAYIHFKSSTQNWSIGIDASDADKFKIIPENDVSDGGETITILPTGEVGIGTSPNSKFAVAGLPVYANNAAAIAGGLAAGDFYRIGGDPDLVCVVH